MVILITVDLTPIRIKVGSYKTSLSAQQALVPLNSTWITFCANYSTVVQVHWLIVLVSCHYSINERPFNIDSISWHWNDTFYFCAVHNAELPERDGRRSRKHWRSLGWGISSFKFEPAVSLLTITKSNWRWIGLKRERHTLSFNDLRRNCIDQHATTSKLCKAHPEQNLAAKIFCTMASTQIVYCITISIIYTTVESGYNGYNRL